jgi:hypothetical protein
VALTKAGPAGIHQEDQMSEQGNEFDVEGHRVVFQVDGPEDIEDTEGHIVLGDNPVEDEDVEAHVQPPRDTDLGNSPR